MTIPVSTSFDELFALKQILETGDVVTSDAWINGPAQTASGAARDIEEIAHEGELLDGQARRSRSSNVPDPQILNKRDAIVKITSTAICGSDLHLYNGFMPTMEKGDILGHEFMGEVVEVGRGREEPQGRRPRRRAVPDRVRRLRACAERQLYSLCENSNPNAWMAEKMLGPHAGGRLRLLAPAPAASPAVRPSTCACRSPTSARSRSRTS